MLKFLYLIHSKKQLWSEVGLFFPLPVVIKHSKSGENTQEYRKIMFTVGYRGMNGVPNTLAFIICVDITFFKIANTWEFAHCVLGLLAWPNGTFWKSSSGM